MLRNCTIFSLAGAGIVCMTMLLGTTSALAHCDGMDGPVVKAAQKALEAGDVNLVLIWVQKKDEAEIRKAFQQTVGVRKLSPEAKQLADTWFFETLVRIHRAGEGAPFTGLKPAGRDLGPAIPAADKAIETGSVDDVLKLLSETTQKGVRDRFAELVARKSFKKDDVDAGREYVEAYVVYVHYVEGLYQAASMSPHGRFLEAEEHEGHAGEQTHEHGQDAEAEGDPSMKVQIPRPLKLEHDELHGDLVKAIDVGGKIGEAATAVAKVLHAHFVKEEEYALPPLGLLSAVSKGEIRPDMRDILTMTDKLKANLLQMLAEHKAIVAALENLKAAAKTEGNQDVARFAEKLTLHAQTEEEVMYPAAILVGEYLKLKLHQ